MRFAFLLGLVGVVAGCDTFFEVKGHVTQCGTAGPIAGVQVVVATDPGAWEGPETETTSTDDSGYYFVGLNKPMDEAATVSFSKAGYGVFSQDFPKGVPSWPYPLDVCLDQVAAAAP